MDQKKSQKCNETRLILKGYQTTFILLLILFMVMSLIVFMPFKANIKKGEIAKYSK
jgi:predicted solute-binding protein